MYRTPNHIGIIPDGNRRWALKNNLNKEEGYGYGLTPGLKLLRAARERGVKELTYYGFTVDNCKRPKPQFISFSKACEDAVKLIEQEDVSVNVCGNTKSACFPERLLKYANREKNTDGRMRVNILVNYGWEWDLKNGLQSRDIPRIDLVVRWGGMCRLSGFLPVQTVYSDFYVVKDLWPDFSESQFYSALDWYRRQDVTLGG